MSALRSEDTVGRFRTIVDMKRNHVANNWAKHYVGLLCVHNLRFIGQCVCAIEARGVVMDNKTF